MKNEKRTRVMRSLFFLSSLRTCSLMTPKQVSLVLESSSMITIRGRMFRSSRNWTTCKSLGLFSAARRRKTPTHVDLSVTLIWCQFLKIKKRTRKGECQQTCASDNSRSMCLSGELRRVIGSPQILFFVPSNEMSIV